MAAIANHQIDARIYESANSMVYRAFRPEDGSPVILKMLLEDCPSPEELTRYRQEYEITRSLDHPMIIKTYGQEQVQKNLVMFLEDIGGVSLGEMTRGKPMEPALFPDLAIKICNGLGAIHEAQLIHKDINPSNIVVNPQTGELKIIDFGIATRLNRENRVIANPTTLEGTLAYIAPEQTGRMNCELDYRGDFYSLGATFYELLCGRPPFQSNDPLELIHSHLVKEPPPPDRLAPGVPPLLSRLIMRLLAKRPEERYQSAAGIAADLKQFRDRWGKDPEVDFQLGLHDRSHRFEIPGKLYGREKETRELLDFFNQPDRNKPALMLVSGYSGVGKTRLVQELYKPITAGKALFFSGKYDQVHKNIPYFAFTAAFRHLVHYLLAESDSELAVWRSQMLAALGNNGQVLMEVFPELALIIGPQPPVPELGPLESQNRFNLTFSEFIKVFCTREHPLVLYLDDLQWIDSPSLDLLSLLLQNGALNHLFVIGAYRNNEVNLVHPLMTALESWQQKKLPIHQLTLEPLTAPDLEQMTAETLDMAPKGVRDLAQIIFRKTGGNAFFATQFLLSLHEEGLIHFSIESDAGWCWDPEKIQARGFTDNIIDLVTGKLQKLPPETREMLQLAACIGNRFDLDTLATVSRQPLEQSYLRLLPALQESFVQPMSNLERTHVEEVDSPLVIRHFKFLHDRVQQSAYAMLDDNAKKQLNLTMGRLLLNSLSPEERSERIFQLVDHLNEGSLLITKPQELLELADLNLIAGKKALAGTAYEAAQTYLSAGRNLLDDETWDNHTQLVFELYLESARAEYLTRNFPEARKLTEQILDRIRSVPDKIRVYKLMVVQCTTHAFYEEAIDAGRKALDLLREPIPLNDLADHIGPEKEAIDKALGGRPISSLIRDTRTPSERIADVLEILDLLAPPAYIFDKSLFALLNMRSTHLALEHGFTRYATTGLACYGVVLTAAYGDFESADGFGRLAMDLAEGFGDSNQRAIAISFVCSYITHWRHHLRLSIPHYNAGTHMCLESGNLNHLGYHIFFKCLHLYHLGEALTALEPLVEETVAQLIRVENRISLDCLRPVQLVVSNLLGKTDGDDVFAASDIDEAGFLKDCEENQSPFALGVFHISKGVILYRMGYFRRALELFREAREDIPHMPGCFTLADLPRFHIIAITALYGEASAEEQADFRVELEEQLAQMDKLAANSPDNFDHCNLMVKAELARIDGRFWDAQQYYEQAARGAADQGFVQDEALAEELAGRFWLEQGNETVAASYLRNAHQSYRRWGAVRLVEKLEQRYPQVLVRERKAKGPGTSTSSLGQELDLDTVIRASSAIRNERSLDALLERVMEISLENAGAEKGVLIIRRNDRLIVKARGVMDKTRNVELLAVELEDWEQVSRSMVQYCARTREPLVLHHACAEGAFTSDPYISSQSCKSVLCMPVLDQGNLVAMLFMENNKVEGAFNNRRLEILALLMTPAAVSLENALLRDQESQSRFTYQVGGSLEAGAASYVTRQADRDLFGAIGSGTFSFVLDARQMGKSTLRVNTMRRLQARNTACAAIDVTMIGGDREEQWYAGMALTLLRSLGLAQTVNLRRWWRENDHLSPVQRLAELISDQILEHIPGELVLFIDEIDSVLSLPFNHDNFFAFIRGCFNRRAEDQRYKRLTFVLLGSVSPNDLIRDKQRTPFNIGRSIKLTGFRFDESRPLLAGLVAKSKQPEVLLREVLAWTNGQPFLTQKVCAMLEQAETNPTEGREAEWVGKLIERGVIRHWERLDEPIHLRTIRDRLLQTDNGVPQLLKKYHRILLNGAVPMDNSVLQARLLLTGLVVLEEDRICVGNLIYTSIFNREWVEETLIGFQNS